MTQNYDRQGLAKAQAGNYQGAIEDFNLALIATPEWGELYYRRGLAYFDLGDLLNAVADYTQALKLDPQHQGTYYARALARLTLKNFPGALDDIDRAIEFGRNYAPAYQLKGLVCTKLTQYPQAITAYKIAASLYLDRQDTEQSRQCLTLAQSLQPKPLLTPTPITPTPPPLISTEQFFTQLLERAENGDLVGAIEDANWAVQTSPDDVQSYACRGVIYLKQGNLQAALSDFDRAIKLDPDSHIAYRSRGKLRSQMEDYGGAIGDFDRAITLDPQDPFIYLARGNAQVGLSNYPGAIADFSKTIALAPTEPSAYLQRGQTYTKLEELNLAIADYQMAANIYLERQDLPKYRDALAQLKKLYRSTPKSAPPDGKYPPHITALRQRLLVLVSGHWAIAERLLVQIEEQEPGHSDEWYLERVVANLEYGL